MRRAFAALLGVSSVVGLAVRNTPMRRALALPMHPALALLGMGMAPLALAATDYIPCSDPCDGGDVNYHLVASVRTVSLLNYTYRGRLFSSGDGRAGGLDDDDDGATAFLGPTLRVRPGQSLWVKLTNDLTSAPDEWGSRPPTVHNYWKMLQNPGEKIKYRYYRRTVADPSLMAVDASNMPGDFDATNLHLHGKRRDVLQWMSRPRPPWTRPPRPRRRDHGHDLVRRGRGGLSHDVVRRGRGLGHDFLRCGRHHGHDLVRRGVGR